MFSPLPNFYFLISRTLSFIKAYMNAPSKTREKIKIRLVLLTWNPPWPKCPCSLTEMTSKALWSIVCKLYICYRKEFNSFLQAVFHWLQITVDYKTHPYRDVKWLADNVYNIHKTTTMNMWKKSAKLTMIDSSLFLLPLILAR